jgi:hypothetical protein
VKGCYLVRVKKELQDERDQEFISLIYAETCEDFFWQVDEQGFDPNSVEYKKVKMGGITLKVEREIYGDFQYFKDMEFAFDQFSESLIKYMDEEFTGWEKDYYV